MLVRLLSIYITLLLALPTNASDFDGHWAGLWRSGKSKAVSVSFTIQKGIVSNYIWDGRNVEVSSSKLVKDKLRVRGPYLNIELAKANKQQLSGKVVNGREKAVFSKTPKDFWRRPPVFFSDYYSDKPKRRAANPRISSVHLDPKCCFGRWTRKAPHAGLDFNVPRHTTAIATADGRVTKFYSAFNNYGCGNGITIRHTANRFSSYCHLESVANLKIGEKVKRGQVVGTVGTSGTSPRDMPHIHFELTTDGDPHDDGDTKHTLDPAPFFVGCFGANLPGEQKLELTYPVQCKSKSFKIKS
ncbi:MAG: M23 family metallopeptidase [Pseudomonadota bacterium]